MKSLPILAALVAVAPLPALAAPGDPLRIVQFDFEGGGGTLFITPNGKTLMVDAGWPAGSGGPAPLPGGERIIPTISSAQRVAAVLKAAGLTRIDYLLTTHYHLDHVGGFEELVKLVPVGTFLDHGVNRETPPPEATPGQIASSPATLYPRYEAAIGTGKRLSLKPGARVDIDGMTLRVTNADGAVAAPLPGAARAGVGCGPAIVMDRNGGEENPRSLGFVASFGRARILMLGDTTRDMEYKLFCPRDRVGPVDLMIATHHGSDLSNAPFAAATVRPTVVVIPNGQTKGGDPSSYDAFVAAGSVKGLWQVHEAVKPGAKNVEAAHIANPAGVADATHPIRIDVARTGTITVTNPRTGQSESYAKSR